MLTSNFIRLNPEWHRTCLRDKKQMDIYLNESHEFRMRHTGESTYKGDRMEGRYANFFQIGYNAFEFLFDFSQQYPESDEVKVHTRIVTSPVYAKALLKTLQESLMKYEKAYGKIKNNNEVSN